MKEKKLVASEPERLNQVGILRRYVWNDISKCAYHHCSAAV